MGIRKTHQQVSEITDDVEALRAHIREHRDLYVFGTGVLVGVLGMRLLGRPQVVVTLVQGA